MDAGTKSHWENVFTSKQPTEVSWYQKIPETSIRLLQENNISKNAHIIDVGCGDSYFIDYLIDNGYKNIYALDISPSALLRLKKRLGKDAQKVNWIATDILKFQPEKQFDFWHDRAAFHFQTDKADIEEYVSIAGRSIVKDGILAVGTFSDKGPEKCSGLHISRYSQQELTTVFASDFQKPHCVTEDHTTPFNTVQSFTFCTFKRL